MADSLLDGGNTSERDEIFNKWKDKTKEEILEAKINSDLFIKTKNAAFDELSRDHLRLREEQNTSVKLQELLDRLDKRSPDDTPITQRDPVNPPQYKPEDIENLVTQKLTEHQTKLKQQDNLRAMQAKLKEQFGEDYQAALKQRLDNLGLTPEFADDLARNHPSVFMKTFELDQTRNISNNAPPRSNIRNTQFAPKATPIRDWNYYQDLKKTNPKAWLDPKIQVQMHNDAIELGDSFGLPQ